MNNLALVYWCAKFDLRVCAFQNSLNIFICSQNVYRRTSYFSFIFLSLFFLILNLTFPGWNILCITFFDAFHTHRTHTWNWWHNKATAAIAGSIVWTMLLSSNHCNQNNQFYVRWKLLLLYLHFIVAHDIFISILYDLNAWIKKKW